ncbi:MAG: hypothetical protein HC869_09490 [Rhodospirillales bacterium]|nr:hypothetical protein [Rhodospirillales bacterium]
MRLWSSSAMRQCLDSPDFVPGTRMLAHPDQPSALPEPLSLCTSDRTILAGG